MEAIVLAAGFGRGLEPITHTRPKPLLPLLDRTLLEYHLDNLKVIGGISRVVVVASYLLDKVGELIRRIESRYPFDVVVVDQGRPLGTAHALLKGLEASVDILVVSSDVANLGILDRFSISAEYAREGVDLFIYTPEELESMVRRGNALALSALVEGVPVVTCNRVERLRQEASSRYRRLGRMWVSLDASSAPRPREG